MAKPWLTALSSKIFLSISDSLLQAQGEMTDTSVGRKTSQAKPPNSTSWQWGWRRCIAKVFFIWVFFFKEAILIGVTWRAGCSERQLGRRPTRLGLLQGRPTPLAQENISACFIKKYKIKKAENSIPNPLRTSRTLERQATDRLLASAVIASPALPNAVSLRNVFAGKEMGVNITPETAFPCGC